MVSTKGATLSSEKPLDLAGRPIAARLDAGQQNCATLILNVREVMASLGADEVLAVVAYDPSAQLDLRAWSRMTGHGYLGMEDHGQFATYYLEKKGAVNVENSYLREQRQ